LEVEGKEPHNRDFEADSPIVTVLASAAPARTRANDGSRLKSLLCGLTCLISPISSEQSFRLEFEINGT
jgi:hypothetical protein